MDLQITNNQSNEIVKHEPLLNCPQLTLNDIENAKMPELEKQVILASQMFPKIRSIDYAESRNTLVEIFVHVIWASGNNMDKDEQMLLINHMIEEVKRDYYHLTLEEVRICFKKGLKGDYGQVFGINVKTFYNWLDAYVTETKVSAMKQLGILKTESEKLKEVSDEEKKYWHKKWLDSCIEAFEEYKLKGEISFIDIRNNLYQYIRHKMRLVDLTSEETENIWNHANIEHKRKHTPDKADTFAQRIDYRNVLDKIAIGDETENQKIKTLARRIALLKLFEKMKIANINFKERIEEYENKLEK